MKNIHFLTILFFLFNKTEAQNLPSLLLGKNINSTFSILAYDEKGKEWGIAVATNNLYVGNSTVYIESGIGAFSVIAETEPKYAYQGFEQLKVGKTIQESIEFTKQNDSEKHYRQVSGIDATGNVYAFTGEALKYWQGKSMHLLNDKFVVMGNQLAENVLDEMAKTYQESTGTLAERLLKSLIAGQNAGGQIQGKQSAALVVKGLNNEWYNNIDLRVDHSQTPFEDLQRLLNYHYGRIRLNQAIHAIRNNQFERGTKLLTEAEQMLIGWNGVYSKIVIGQLLLGNEEKAINYIEKGLAENPNWQVYIPAFYVLKNNPKYKHWTNEDRFSEKDWASAISTLLQLNKTKEAVELSNLKLAQFPTSLMYYNSGKSYAQAGELQKAKKHLEKALELDSSNTEALILLKMLNKKTK